MVTQEDLNDKRIQRDLELLECEKGNHTWEDLVHGPDVVGKACIICGLEKDYTETEYDRS